MTIAQAEQEITRCAQLMRVRYGDREVFDEWALISLDGSKVRVLAYTGPRKEGFRKNFVTDVSPLAENLTSKAYHVGDFEFCRDAVGTGFEAFVVAGEGVYLLCNNTAQTMEALTKDPLWIGAQVPFVELSEKFRNNPVLVDGR